MAKKIRLTRPELKRQRDALERYERYLPMLKLKQQQLQMSMRQVERQMAAAATALAGAQQRFGPYEPVLAQLAGVNVRALAAVAEVRTGQLNIAGVNVPVFQEAVFPPASYSLFATPAWVDRALADLRGISRAEAEIVVLREQQRLLQHELAKIGQRVNLFEKVKIPESSEAIRVIRIHLGDEMTAAVGRAKIAKAKLSEESLYESVTAAPEAEE